VLIDGSQPTSSTLSLIDVNAPDVAYNGRRLVFAGLPQGNYSTEPLYMPSAWRIYTINVDGSDLRQVTFAETARDLSHFGEVAGALAAYDDTDPVWLPDGRIVFSSTRWPSLAQYSAVRTSDLYVVDADGANLHRITAERNGADRPVVDPLTGKIVFSRWWRNHRFVAKTDETIADAEGGYLQHLGLSTDRTNQHGGPDFLWRNAWHAATINPDGTELALWAGTFRDEEANHMYGGAFAPDGDLIANFFPMLNMTEAGGFGGLRRYQRGPGSYQPVLGVVQLTFDYLNKAEPPSHGVQQGPYATDAAFLPDGRMIVSLAPDIGQDYGLYTINQDGSNLKLLYDNPGTSEIRTKVIAARPLPPIRADRVTQVASLYPPDEDGPYTGDGVFTFDALNVYFNAPVDTDIVDAPPVGSVAVMRFFLDHQRQSHGSLPNLDWPILLEELPVEADGSVRNPNAPANLPLFEQARSADGRVPFTINHLKGERPEDGATHVAGMNYGRPGTIMRCVGCHAGHTLLPVPRHDDDAQWSNLATGATVSVSSARNPDAIRGLNDRLVLKGAMGRYWASALEQPADGQWVQLIFPVPISVRTVRLYNPRFGDEANASVQVHGATVYLYSDEAGTLEVASQTLNQDLPVSGADLHFADVKTRVIKVVIDSVSGTLDEQPVASLAEIEVIGRGE
ncbi:MAG: hypothetical protein M3Q45_08705, partial [Chloroflexota bacterium]|nr:hypothetical protein [Chloroflexota bacterium]